MWIFIDDDCWYWDDSYYLDTSFTGLQTPFVVGSTETFTTTGIDIGILGDDLVAEVITDNTAITTPAGWTLITGSTTLWNAGGLKYTAYSIRRGASAPALTWAATTVFSIVITAIRPVRGYAATYNALANSANATTAISPSLSTSTNNAIVLLGLAILSSATITPPSGFNVTLNDGAGGLAAVNKLKAGAGATGTNTWTLSIIDQSVSSTITVDYSLVDLTVMSVDDLEEPLNEDDYVFIQIDSVVVITDSFIGSDESTDALVTEDDYSFTDNVVIVIIADDFIGSDETTDVSNDELDFSFIDVNIVITDDLVSSDELVDIDLNELDFSFTDDVAALLTDDVISSDESTEPLSEQELDFSFIDSVIAAIDDFIGSDEPIDEALSESDYSFTDDVALLLIDDVIAAQEELEPTGDDLEFSFTGINDVIVIIDDVIVSSEELAEWIDDSEFSFIGLDTAIVLVDSLIVSNEDELISLWLDTTSTETSYTDFSSTVSPSVLIKKKYKGAWDSTKRKHIFTRLQWEQPLAKAVEQAIDEVAQLDLSSNDAEIALRMRLQAFKWQSEYLDIALALQSALQAQISTSIEQIKQQFDYEHYLEAMRLVTLRQENNRRIILYIMNQ